jgi:PPK2 family polyphosphate:nucleotide phosphotransferase
MSINLSKISTRAPKEFDKDDTKDKTASLLEELDELQNLLYAEGKHSVLVVIQGMDASGKDGAIKNVFGTLNPQGISVKSFKVPTAEETLHDFLWRIHQHAPAKGSIQIFNRSHYENVLVVRVRGQINDKTAHKRMKAMNDFERLLQEHNNTLILKFFLHVSKDEQTERLKERLTDERKHWKANPNDFKEAELWNEYMKAYEDCFERCNDIPWTIVPADQNWYKEYVITSLLVEKLKELKMKYPELKEEEKS